MNKEKKNEQAAGAAKLVSAKIADFRKGKRNQYDRMVKAVKPITDVWYKRMKNAAECGVEELFAVWEQYNREVIRPAYLDSNEGFFRYAAAVMIFHSIENLSGKLGENFHPGVGDLATHLCAYLFMLAHERFDDGARNGITVAQDAIYAWNSIVWDIDTLHLEYEVAA